MKFVDMCDLLNPQMIAPLALVAIPDDCTRDEVCGAAANREFLLIALCHR